MAQVKNMQKRHSDFSGVFLSGKAAVGIDRGVILVILRCYPIGIYRYSTCHVEMFILKNSRIC